MGEEEKKAIEITKTIIEFAGDSYIPKENRNALQTLLNLIEKQGKVIDEIAQELINAPLRVYSGDAFKFRNIEDTKQYFYRKVEEDESL